MTQRGRLGSAAVDDAEGPVLAAAAASGERAPGVARSRDCYMAAITACQKEEDFPRALALLQHMRRKVGVGVGVGVSVSVWVCVWVGRYVCCCWGGEVVGGRGVCVVGVGTVVLVCRGCGWWR